MHILIASATLVIMGKTDTRDEEVGMKCGYERKTWTCHHSTEKKKLF